jgi:SARP family transcriptional regulator, regulator of embCAB operon
MVRKMFMFRVLGPSEIACNGIPVPVTGSFRITLLGALIFGRNPITPQMLREELWGSSMFGNFQNSLQAHVSRVRHMLRELEPDRRESRITYVPGMGYYLSVDDEEVDARIFASAVQSMVKDKTLCGRPPELARRLRSALSAWRGPVLGGIVGGPICQTATAQYEELRLQSLERLFDTELACGNHIGIIPELSALVETYTPSVERFCEQLMTALLRAGRQVDALNVYRRTRELLLKSTGATPSPRLQMHESAVLRHDDGLYA